MAADRRELANMSLEDQFQAAVNVIQSLPKNGQFQPSNEVKLKFYSFFKQATEGPNNAPKPAFYDIVAKAKWDAWKKLDKMSKEQAMSNYVDELKKIVETMSYSEEIAEFYDVLGPFYELVNESPKKKNVKMNGDIPKNGANNGNNYNYNHKVISEYTTFNGGMENGGSSDGDSDGDEFSDTFDNIGNVRNEGSEGISLDSEAQNGFSDDIIRARGEADVSSRRIATSGISSRPSSSRSHLNRGVTNPAFQDANLNTAVAGSGAGGGGGNGQYYSSSHTEVNEQITLAILRLQQSLDQINNRITIMETRLNSSSSLSVSNNLKKWWPFSICPKTMTVLLLWPFMVHFVLNAVKERRRK